MLAYAPMEYKQVGAPAEINLILARQNQRIQENLFNIAPSDQITIARIEISALTGSFSENSSSFQHFDSRKLKHPEADNQM